MPIDLAPAWIIALNVGGWLAIQLGLAWTFTKMPDHWFNPAGPHWWERAGRFYETVFRIKTWKDWLPDAAHWFDGGFAKAALGDTRPEYLERFIRETFRAELCHWTAIACAPVFFLWNPWWGDLIIVGYALAANLPCILAQRYNRARLTSVLRRKTHRDKSQHRSDNPPPTTPRTTRSQP
ncbi:MAG: hypothetical protein RMH97_10005 [Verrucomicrobiales bacterium]|nr:hypothetical protein [Verrucomicrobiales bacterium]